MKPWQRAVAVPLLVLLVSAGIAATLLYKPAPAKKVAPSRRPLKPLLTPPLRHGGCQGRFWLTTEKDLRHPQNYKTAPAAATPSNSVKPTQSPAVLTWAMKTPRSC